MSAGNSDRKVYVYAVFFPRKQQEVPGTPAGRPLFVLSGVPWTPSRCSEDFSSFFFPECLGTCARCTVQTPFVTLLSERLERSEKAFPKGSKRCFPDPPPRLATEVDRPFQRDNESLKTAMFPGILVPSHLGHPLNTPL